MGFYQWIRVLFILSWKSLLLEHSKWSSLLSVCIDVQEDLRKSRYVYLSLSLKTPNAWNSLWSSLFFLSVYSTSLNPLLEIPIGMDFVKEFAVLTSLPLSFSLQSFHTDSWNKLPDQYLAQTKALSPIKCLSACKLRNCHPHHTLDSPL